MPDESFVRKNMYFRYRKVEPDSYPENIGLPLWIKQEITDKNMNIMDFGCGFGQMMRAFHNEGCRNVFGVDIEKTAIDFCTTNGLTVREVSDTEFENPFDFRFDMVLMSHVLEHIQKNEIIHTLEILREKFLNRNGILLISTPNAQSNTGCYWAYEDWTHSTLFASDSLYYILRSAGFIQIDFLDIDCTLGMPPVKALIRKSLLAIYKMNRKFWNKVTCSYYHAPSPEIYSFELKAKKT